jgi:hypothetical protein
MLQSKFVDKIKTHILCSITISENRNVYEIMWKKYGIAGEATDDNRAHAHFMLHSKGYKHTLRICNTAFFSPCNSDFTRAPQIYVIYILPLLFRYDFCVISSLDLSKITIESISFNFSYSGTRGYQNSPRDWL